MFAFHKSTAQSQRLCTLTGTRVLVLGVALITCAAFSFQRFSLAPGSRPVPFFLPNSTNYAVAIAPSYPPNSATTLRWDEENSMAPAADDDLDPDFEEESQELGGDLRPIELGDGARIQKVDDPHGGHLTLVLPEPGEVAKHNSSASPSGGHGMENNSLAPPPIALHLDRDARDGQNNGADSPAPRSAANGPSSLEEVKKETDVLPAHRGEIEPWALPYCRTQEDRAASKRRKRTVTTTEMYQTLQENRRCSTSMAPRWPSPVDGQISKAKRQIFQGAPTVENDAELYSPVFRNVSMFKRSYELMEKMLKVYIYKEGKPPIFHHPPLGGIYASEGWFMMQMEASRRFVVDDPRRAHLFYMPFSSSRLRFQLYIPGSHGHRNLIEFLRKYVETIAGKYPFWNRTGGADHFLAACHDWASDETAKAMGNTIRALCNADVTRGFELGKDVSLPETRVAHGGKGRDPLQDLAWKPSMERRPLLAFFAGQMHGYLRPLLLQHWENKYADMKITGPMHHVVDSVGGRRTTRHGTGAVYTQFMRSSRYCICPRGYEVNSPRVVEAIVNGCVPVIISNGFVPPFFEELDWEAFSVVVPEAEVPRLRELLLGIPKKKLLALQAGVRGVRKHFLWHRQPEKYDLFHMILHSVWLNRVHGFHRG